MLFNSLEFLLLFLPIAILGYGVATRFGRNLALAWLLLVSLLFYAWWSPPFLALLLGSIALNYGLGVLLARRPEKWVLGLGIALNLAPLAYFKYAGFLVGGVQGLAGTTFELAAVALPLGISFFTFQQIGFLVDIKTRALALPKPLDYGLFVSFFPQLIAGPIVRGTEMLPQFRGAKIGLAAENLAVGLTLVVLGLVKKVIISDACADYADPMFTAAAEGQTITFLDAWSGALAFGLQIYFDFSGYSTIAIGLAALFGFRIPFNFLSPYKATSIIEFWRRWHVTLSRFLRDFLYIPLGGKHGGSARRYRNIMIVMLLGGLWHGAGWTFVAWGALHGAFLVVNHGWRAFAAATGLHALGERILWRWFCWFLTFMAITTAWVLFRSEDIPTATNILTGMVGAQGRLLFPDTYGAQLPMLVPLIESLGGDFIFWTGRPFAGGEQVLVLSLALAVALLLPTAERWVGVQRAAPEQRASPDRTGLLERLSWRPSSAIAAGMAVLAMIVLGLLSAPSQFVYFEF